MRFWINRNNATTTRSSSGNCGFSSDFTATWPITVGTSPTGGSWGENSGRLLVCSGALPLGLRAKCPVTGCRGPGTGAPRPGIGSRGWVTWRPELDGVLPPDVPEPPPPPPLEPPPPPPPPPPDGWLGVAV